MRVQAHIDCNDGEKIYAGVDTDITEEEALRKQMEHLLLHDNLTGLPTRELIKINAISALSSAKRVRANIGLIFMDLDFFKDLNDTHGELAGDNALKEVARRLQATLGRKSDTLARLSGDEFVVLLTGLKNPKEDMPVIFGRIRAAIDDVPFIIDDKKLHLEISLGSSVYSQDVTETDTLKVYEELLQKACKRMHVDKEQRFQRRQANGDTRRKR